MDFNRLISREDIQMINKHQKRCQTSLVMIEMQIQNTVRYPYILARMSIIEGKLKITNVDNDVENLEPLNIAYANVKWCGLLYNSLEFPPHKKNHHVVQQIHSLIRV